MRIEIKHNIRIIKNHSHTFEKIVDLVNNQINSFLDLSLILDLTFNIELKFSDLKSLNPIKKSFDKVNLSFVVVNDSVNLTDKDSNIVVVPTILEAHDIIQLDNIQRELGF